MPDFSHFLIFLTAAILLAVAPGPGMLYVLARTLAGGRREGLLSSLGTFFGGMVHVFAAAAGISIILAKPALAFATVKYLGAAYLCFHGVRMILDARKGASAETRLAAPATQNRDGDGINGSAPAGEAASCVSTSGARRSNPLSQGVLTEVLNPKTALFFLSFIPQFVNHTRGHVFERLLHVGRDVDRVGVLCLHDVDEDGVLAVRAAAYAAIERRVRDREVDSLHLEAKRRPGVLHGEVRSTGQRHLPGEK